MEQFLIPLLLFALLGGLFGLLLAVAARAFAVKEDERLAPVREALPGGNCGGCGYSGCDAYAAAVVRGEAPPDLCGVGGAESAAQIAAVMGLAVSGKKPLSAVVLCSGCDGVALKKYHYAGAPDCHSAARMAGGDKRCAHSCIGLGSCAAVCPFGAISVADGVAKIDPAACRACGLCVSACPMGVIRLLPKDAPLAVLCSSHEDGKSTRAACTVGCIGCRICEKKCPTHAIRVENNLALIDPDLCTGCGACAQACPRKIIKPILS